MNHLKKLIISGSLVIAILPMAGCFNFFGDNTQGAQPTDPTMSVYQTNEFSISVPKDWEVIEKNDFTSGVPPETVVVFRNNVKNETFTANVNIVERSLQTPLDATEYANLANNRQTSGLVDYNELRKEDSTITVGDRQEGTYFVAFEARKASGEPLVRYLQTYGVSGNNAYIVTGAVSPQENDNTVNSIENIVRSFQLK